MRKLFLGILAVTAFLLVVPEAAARPKHKRHKHGGNDGLALAAGIIHLVKEVVAPTPVVVAPPPQPVVVTPPPVVVAPPPRPVVVTPPPRHPAYRPAYRPQPAPRRPAQQRRRH